MNTPTISKPANASTKPEPRRPIRTTLSPATDEALRLAAVRRRVRINILMEEAIKSFLGLTA